MVRSSKTALALALTSLLLAASWAWADDKSDKDKSDKDDKPFQKLVNRNSEKVVGVYNKATNNGAKCVQWDFKAGEKNQHWRVVPGSGGWSYLENANSKTFLSVKLSYKNVRVGKRIQKVIAGADVCIADKVAGDASQMWKMLPAAGKDKDYFRLINRATNTVLTVDGSSQKSGAKLILAADAKTAKSQHWKLDKLDAE